MHRLLDGVRGLLVLRPDGDEECPFSCVCVFDSGSLREHVRQALIEARIYPAVLWPLSTPVFPDPVEHVELSTRFLSIHADARSDSEDIEHVANASRRAVEGFRT